MKHSSRFVSCVRDGLLAVALLSAPSASGVLTTNSYTSAVSMPWDSGVIGTWSVGAPAIGNAACVISNAGIKTVTIVDTTSAASRTISNLIVSAPVGPNFNTLSLATTNTFTVLQGMTIGTNSALTVTNATVDVKGQAGGFVTDNGAITINNGTVFLATNALSGLDIGHSGTGSLTLNGGRLEIIGQKVGTFPGDKGTLTIAGGTNVVTTDGLFIGDSAGATGVVWLISGALIETNTSIYLGNLGSGRITVTNGNLITDQLIIGNTAGGAGTLTVVGGTVETPDIGLLSSLLLGQSAGGTGTIWLTGGLLVSTNPATTRIGDSGAGMLVVSNGTVSLWRAVLGYTAGAGTLSVAGGTLNLIDTGTDFILGNSAGTRGTVSVSAGQLVMTNNLSDNVLIGDAGIGEWTHSGGTGRVVDVVLANGTSSTGTLTVSGGLLTGSGSITVGEGSSSVGRLWVTGGSLSFTDKVTLVADPAGSTGSITVSNGTAELREMTVGVFGSGALTVVGGTLHSDVSFTLAGNSDATGNLTQSGGWLITTNGTSTGTGIVNIQSTGGTWLAGGLSFAYANAGTFTISGGTNILDGGLTIGSSMGSGAVWVTSGKLIATNGSTSIASDSISQFAVTGGVVQLRDVTIAVSSPAGSLTVVGGAVTFDTTLAVGIGFGSSGTLTVSGGQLTVNGDSQLGIIGGTGTLKVSGGSLTAQAITLGVFGGTGGLQLTGGALSVTNLVATSGPASPITFNAGTLHSAATAVTNTAQLAVGNGVSAAHFHVVGGTHAFNNGLRIRNNATLSGCGTIASTVVVDAGGTVVADCGGLLTFTGSVTNNGLIKATGGTTLEFYSAVINNGVIDVILGNTNFHAGVVNNGIILDASSDYDGDGQSNLAETQAGTDATNSVSAFRITSIARTNNDIHVTWMTGPGKTNALERSTGTANGSYSNNFAAIFTVTNTVGTTTNYLDIGAATNVPAFYYRVRLVP